LSQLGTLANFWGMLAGLKDFSFGEKGILAAARDQEIGKFFWSRQIKLQSERLFAPHPSALTDLPCVLHLEV